MAGVCSPVVDFLRLLTPSDPAFEAAALAIHAERPDVAAAMPDPRGVPYRKWLAVYGAHEYPGRIGRFLPPLPPVELAAAGCGSSAGLESHLKTGLEDFEKLGEVVSTYGARPFGETTTVLDFGCGTGRVLRWFRACMPDARLVGVETFEQGLAFCRDGLGVEAHLTAGMPPLDLPDDSVDLVTAYSVFTHLDLETNRAWLRELVRVCKPDGLLFLTTIGEWTLFVTQRSPDHQKLLALDIDGARGLMRRLVDEPFVFHPKPEGGASRDWGHGCPVAFFSDRFVRDEWAREAQVLAHVPAIQDLWQDAWILRPH